MVIDDLKKEEVISSFKGVFENKEQAKALNHANSDIFKHLAEVLQTDKKSVTSAYKYWKELHEKGDDPLEEIVDIFEAIKE